MIPKISFHGGHSGELCDHAKDTKESILKMYIGQGFTSVALTEHLPPTHDRFLYPDEIALGHNAAFLQRRFNAFFDITRHDLHARFGDDIQLFIGFETEYYGPNPCKRIEQAIERYKPDIVVGSIHHVDDIPIDFDRDTYQRAVEHCGGVEALYARYYDQQYELIRCLGNYTNSIPVILGHMDLIKIFKPAHTPSPDVWHKIKRNIELAISCNIIIEINARAFKKELREPYPNKKIIEYAIRAGGQVTLGDDSHGDDQIGLHYAEVFHYIKHFVTTVTSLRRTFNGDTMTYPIALGRVTN